MLAGTTRRDVMPSGLKFVRAMRESFVSVWPDEVYARDVTQVRIGLRTMFVANAPALVKHVLLDNAANYHKTPILRRLFEPALGQGLLTAEGAVWKQHRQLMAPIFAQRRMAALVAEMTAATRSHVEGWPTETEFDLTAALSALTLDIITRTMFGAENHDDVAAIAEDTGIYQRALRPSLLDFVNAPQWIPRPGTRQARAIGARLTGAITTIVARRGASSEVRDDLLGLLLQAVGRGELSEREIRDEIATIFTAGHDTTAGALEWVLYLLDRHPEIEERLRVELRTVLEGRPPEAADLDRLSFTRCVIEEAMRLYPPAHSMTRIALAPDRLGDVTIPKGAVVVISPWLLHRNPNFWREPALFDPDRFNASRPRERYSYIPFGAGPRICIGAGFAMTEIAAILATMLPGTRLRLSPTHPVEPAALITMRPKFGLRAVRAAIS